MSCDNVSLYAHFWQLQAFCIIIFIKTFEQKLLFKKLKALICQHLNAKRILSFEIKSAFYYFQTKKFHTFFIYQFEITVSILSRQ